MKLVQTTLPIAALTVPPLLMLAMPSKWLAFLLGVPWFWGTLVIGAQYSRVTE